jgi:hypothetical protein
MRSAFRHLGLILLGLALVVPTLSAQDKDKDKKDSTEHKEKLIKINDIAGKITNVDPQDKSISLQLGRKNEKIMTIDDVKVRSKNPPIAYDDKGNKKKYTAKELKELRGDAKLPGYAADFNDLKANQVVEVSLVYKKSDKTRQPYASVILIVTQPN